MIFFDKKLIQFSCYIFYLLPLALLTGPFIPDLIISFIALVFIYISIKEKEFKYYNNLFFYFLVIFYILIIISASASNFKLNSFESSLFYWRFGIFALATWYLINSNDKFLKNFTYFFIIIFSIALFDSIYQFINGINIFGFSTEKSNRLVLLLNDKVILGGYLSRMLPLLIGLIIFTFKNNFFKYFLIFLYLFLTDISIYLSGERTALGLIFIASLMIILLIKNFRIMRIITLFLSIFAIILISFFNPDVKVRNIDKTYSQMFEQKENQKPTLFSIQHESHIITAFNMFKEKPIIGHGPNSFRLLCSDKSFEYNDLSCSTHPHNIYIQLLAEVGLLGTIIFLLLPLSILYIIFKHIMASFTNPQSRYTDFQICIIACITLSIFPFLPTQNFFNNYINVIFYLPIGFFLYAFYDNELINK